MVGRVVTKDRSHRVEWHLPGPAGHAVGDACLATALVPAMVRGEPLEIDTPVSRRLLANVGVIQDIFVSWAHRVELVHGVARRFVRVPISAATRAGPGRRSEGGVACFFTGGVDSFYSVLKHRSELTALVFVHGFDVPLSQPMLRARIAGGVREAADELGLPLIEVVTDLREFSDRYVPWEEFHGAALAGVGHLLSTRFRRVYVPATTTYASLVPLGSHPLVDPLWSTEQIEFVHDGCEATRLQKLEILAACGPATRWLRVCPKNAGGAYNCGRCEKCARTMTAVRVLGASSLFSSLPELDTTATRNIARLRLRGRVTEADWRHYAYRLAQIGNDRSLARAVRIALLHADARRLGRSLRSAVRKAAAQRR